MNSVWKKAQFVTERGKGKKDECAEKSKSEAIAWVICAHWAGGFCPL